MKNYSVIKKILSLLNLIIFLGCISLYSQTYNDNNLIHQIHYSTYDQSMWGPTGAFFLDFEYELFNIQVDENFQYGDITEFIGGEFGLMVDMGIWMYFSSTFSMTGFSGGSIDVEYPVEITLEFPDDYTFDQGQTITIHSSYIVQNNHALDTYFPQAGIVTLDFKYGFGMNFDAIVCIYDCDTIPLIPSIGFPVDPYDTDPLPHDSIAIFHLNGQTGEVAYPCLDTGDGSPGICEGNVLPIIIPDWFGIGLTGEINLPNVETYDWINDVTQCLHAYGQDPWMEFDLNLMQFLHFLAGFIPPPNGPAIQQAITFLEGGTYEYELLPGVVAVIDYFILHMNLHMTNWMTQDFSFCPTIWATLHFPTPLEFTETDPSEGNEIVNSGVAQDITFQVNNDLNIVYPCYNWDSMYVNPVIYDITNDFTNHTYDSITFDFVLEAILFHITISLGKSMGVTAMPEFQLPQIAIENTETNQQKKISATSPQIINPEIIIRDFVKEEYLVVTEQMNLSGSKDLEFCFPSNCEPLISESYPLFSFNLTWFNDTWELPGFEQGIQFPGTWLIPKPPLDIEVEVENVLCFGDSTGVISVTAINSTGPYTWEYSNGVVNTHEGPTDEIYLPAGYYYITLTDIYGCEKYAEVNIIDENPPLLSNLYSTDVLCAGDSTGTITAHVTGGVPPYTFYWEPTESTEQNLENIYAGWHYLTITDNVGCEHYDSIFINEPDAPLSFEYDKGMVSCHGLPDGYIDIEVFGGTPPYTYEWSNGSTIQDLLNIPAGTYSVTITDANKCFIEASFIITEPDSLVLELHYYDVLCHGDNSGYILVNATGGTPQYSYQWNNGATTAYIENLYAGNYIVTVTDANNCKAYEYIQISQPNSSLSTSIEAVNVRCFGEKNGKANLTVTGGTPPYLYEWSNGKITKDIDELPPGMYFVTVTDNNGCQAFDDVQIIQPEQPMSGSISGTHVTCNGGEDGNVYIEVEGGWTYEHPDYDYIYVWSNNSWDENQIGIPAGVYSVTVTDSNGCHYIMEFEVTEPEPLIVKPTEDITICDGMDAEIGIAVISGGNPPYTIYWSNGGSGMTTNVSPLETTTYTATVVDAEDCEEVIVEITVFVLDKIEIEVSTNTDIVCPGDTVNFNVEITGGGVSGNVVFVNDSLMNLPISIPVYNDTVFTFTAYDTCEFNSVTTQYLINAHPLPPISISADKTSGCSPLTVQFTEHSPDVGQTYIWDFDTGDVENLSFYKNPIHTFYNATSYRVKLSVKSVEGCVNDTSISITVFPIPEVNFTASSANLSLLSPIVNFTNLTIGGYFYNWTFGDGGTSSATHPTHSYHAPGLYYVQLEAISLHGCADTAGMRINVTSDIAVWAPTAFTPNRDGLNETFKVFVTEIDFRTYELFVYNRWGEIVFYGNDYDVSWDGTYNDMDCPDGIYAWAIVFFDKYGNEYIKTGTVTLIR